MTPGSALSRRPHSVTLSMHRHRRAERRTGLHRAGALDGLVEAPRIFLARETGAGGPSGRASPPSSDRDLAQRESAGPREADHCEPLQHPGPGAPTPARIAPGREAA